jgi:comEA protein
MFPMNIIKKINQTLGFTKNEGRIVIFLVAAFLIGCCIKIYMASTHSMKRFDYSASDSVFAERSRLANSPESTLTAGNDTLSGAKDSSQYADAADLSVDEDGKINLNTATKEQLISLPGIGDVSADLILAYREKHGKFKTLGDLRNIHGIGQKKIERLSSYITLGE